MKTKMSRKEALEIVGKYDPQFRDFLRYNAQSYGLYVELYAEHLKELHEKKDDSGITRRTHLKGE